MKFVVFRWTGSPSNQKYVSGAKEETKYTSNHVNNIEKMLLETQVEKPQLVCVTNDPSGLNKSIEAFLIGKAEFDFIQKHGGRFFKLFMFSERFQDFMGEKFIYLDLDTSICGDLSSFAQINSDLVAMEGINSNKQKEMTYKGADLLIFLYRFPQFLRRFLRTRSLNAFNPNPPWCRLNSSFMIIAPGTGNELWSGFDGKVARKKIKRANLIGTDQAWIHLKFLGSIQALGQAEGIWRGSQVNEYYKVNNKLPENLKIIAFPGKPEKKPWVSEMVQENPWIQKVYPNISHYISH